MSERCSTIGEAGFLPDPEPAVEVRDRARNRESSGRAASARGVPDLHYTITRPFGSSVGVVFGATGVGDELNADPGTLERVLN